MGSRRPSVRVRLARLDCCGRYGYHVAMSDHKTCPRCGVAKPSEAFGRRTVRGRPALRAHCRSCESKKRWLRRKATGREGDIAQRAAEGRYREKMKGWRSDPAHLARIVLQDSKGRARKKELEHSLTLDEIVSLVAQPCSYCGETELRMTLDRADNARGYVFENVAPACIRCNYARKNMPYAAWIEVAKGMRSAREQGLFGDWTGRAR